MSIFRYKYAPTVFITVAFLAGFVLGGIFGYSVCNGRFAWPGEAEPVDQQVEREIREEGNADGR